MLDTIYQIRSENKMVKIATFNVLSNSYCNKETYPSYPSEALNNKLRWQKIEKVLVTLMDEGVFICLQEVCEYIRAKLEVLVRQHEYSMVATNYDHFFSGYMGVATLYPSKYKLIDCQFIRPANLVRKYITAETEPSSNGWFWDIFYAKKEKVCEWYNKISKRNNVLLALTFRDDDEDFTIANYHAPCVYRCQKSMCVVAACLLKAMNDFKSDKVYLAGDFNIQPDSLPYLIITRGGFWTDNDDLLQLRSDIDKMELKFMESAYKKIHQTEPEVTCKADTCIRGVPNSFEGCLDYIFYRDINGRYDPIDMEIAPEENILMPNINWPSDHKLLLAHFD